MTVFAVSFRIESQTTNLGTYTERYESVNAAIKAQANGRLYWNQTTSFWALVSDQQTSGDLAKAIDYGSKLDKSVDLLLTINLSSKGYTVLGQNSDKDIDDIMKAR